jgi:hypothetical protein
MLFDIFHTNTYLEHWLWQLITPHSWSWNWAHGRCDLSTGDAYSARHLIPPLLFLGVLVSLIFTVDSSIYPNLTLILTADSFVSLTRLTYFHSGLFRLPHMDTLILTTDFAFEIGHTAVLTARQGCLHVLLLGTLSHLPYIWRSMLAHLFLWLVIPTCVLRLITFWYPSHLISAVLMSTTSHIYEYIVWIYVYVDACKLW